MSLVFPFNHLMGIVRFLQTAKWGNQTLEKGPVELMLPGAKADVSRELLSC